MADELNPVKAVVVCFRISHSLGPAANAVCSESNIVFDQQFIQQLLVAAKPFFKEIVKEVLADEQENPTTLCMDYDDAGRMIGTTYEGIRKMVRKGDLKATKQGRRRGIAVSELKDYVQRNTN